MNTGLMSKVLVYILSYDLKYTHFTAFPNWKITLEFFLNPAPSFIYWVCFVHVY